MKNGFFITGTGTGVGKTIFTAGLLAMLRGAGINASPLKAMQTGSTKEGVSEDLRFIFKASGFKPEKNLLEYMMPYTFTRPCSPHLAAEMDKKPAVSIPTIVSGMKKLLEHYDMVLMEGAGGVLVPLDRKKKQTMADLICAAGLPVIVVASAGLGTINHTCLTLEAMKGRKAKIIGFVLNDGPYKDGSYMSKDNAKVIEQFSGVKWLGTIPRIKNMKGIADAFGKIQGFKNLVKRGLIWTGIR
jgi:dethiobiotin synthetase